MYFETFRIEKRAREGSKKLLIHFINNGVYPFHQAPSPPTFLNSSLFYEYRETKKGCAEKVASRGDIHINQVAMKTRRNNG